MVEIIDSQVHDPEPSNVRGVPDSMQFAITSELAIAAMDAIGVDIAAVNEVAPGWCEFAVANYPDRFVGVANVDHMRSDVDTYIERLSSTPGIVALRTVIPLDASVDPSSKGVIGGRRGLVRGVVSDDLVTAEFHSMLVSAEKWNMPVFMPSTVVTASGADEYDRVIGAHPGVKFILDHIGVPQPPGRQLGDDPFYQLQFVLPLARHSNAYLKLSGAQTLSRSAYPHDDLWPSLHRVLAAYGCSRVMWGSDYTRLRFRRGTTDVAPRSDWISLYSDSLNYLRDTSELSLDEKAQILGGTFRREMRLDD